MKKKTLILLSSSTFLSSMLLTLISDKSVKAVTLTQEKASDNADTNNTQKAVLNCQLQNCTGNAHLTTFNRLFMAKAEGSQAAHQKVIELNMTDAESDAAIKKFGCDCPKAINALRQMRGITVGVEGEYLSPTHKITPCTDKKLPNNS
ncbi:MAG: hypothetical protein DSM106950_23435 [Stigonema ocellatum SAG 48.90 = DSM 106950]|nr:hypothetical protein [Stigonema ocellatum SAG 48.90 = DSM 106950]